MEQVEPVEEKQYEPGHGPATEPVAAEEVAEAEEDADKAAKLQGLEKFHALADLEDATVSTILNATVAGDHALLNPRNLRQLGFSPEDQYKCKRVHDQLVQRHRELANVKKSSNPHPNVEATIKARIKHYFTNEVQPLIEEVYKTEVASRQAETDQPMAGPEAMEYGVAPVDAPPAKPTPVPVTYLRKKQKPAPKATYPVAPTRQSPAPTGAGAQLLARLKAQQAKSPSPERANAIEDLTERIKKSRSRSASATHVQPPLDVTEEAAPPKRTKTRDREAELNAQWDEMGTRQDVAEEEIKNLETQLAALKAGRQPTGFVDPTTGELVNWRKKFAGTDRAQLARMKKVVFSGYARGVQKKLDQERDALKDILDKRKEIQAQLGFAPASRTRSQSRESVYEMEIDDDDDEVSRASSAAPIRVAGGGERRKGTGASSVVSASVWEGGLTNTQALGRTWEGMPASKLYGAGFVTQATPAGAILDEKKSLDAMKQEMKDFGYWKPEFRKDSRNNKGLARSAAPGLTHNAFWSTDTSTHADGPFVAEYQKFLHARGLKQKPNPKSGVSRDRPLPLHKVLYYSDVSKYPTATRKQLQIYSDEQLKLLDAFFHQRHGMESAKVGSMKGDPKWGIELPKLRKAQWKGRFGINRMRQYIEVFGVSSKFKNKRALLHADKRELFEECRRIAATLEPILDQVGGGKGAWFGVQVLKNGKGRAGKRRKQDGPPAIPQYVPSVVPSLENPRVEDDHHQTTTSQQGTTLHKVSREKTSEALANAPESVEELKLRLARTKQKLDKLDYDKLDFEEYERRGEALQHEIKRIEQKLSIAHGWSGIVEKLRAGPQQLTQQPRARALSATGSRDPSSFHGTSAIVLQAQERARALSATGSRDPSAFHGTPAIVHETDVNPFSVVGRSRGAMSAEDLQLRPPVRGARASSFGSVSTHSIKQERADALAARPLVNQHHRRTHMSAEAAYPGVEAHTSYTHLIKGDLAPVGRVHLVKMGNLVGDQRDHHILAEMDADANMGAKTLREQSRRGPFKASSGRSRVLDRSAHVSYRRRGKALEITIRRGVTEYELDTLIGKLGAHRVGSHNAFLYIIKGNSKKKIGVLDRIDLTKLRDKIEECLITFRVVGLLLQDTHERSVLHKAYSHGMEMKDNYRNLFGPK